MTKQEIEQRFHVPERVLEEYEKNIRSNSMEPYTDNDLALLSQIVTLYEIGFSSGQVQEYLKTSEKSAQLVLLNQKRQELLNALHQQEERLDKLDFLRYKLQHMRELDEKKLLNGDVIDGIMMEDKKEVDKVILTGAELSKYFGKETTPREMKDQIIKLLDDWKGQQKEHEKPEKKTEQEK